MREFKFIRGKYTNENIFNSDETKACLFAYDSEGNLVQFTEKNNKEFQDKFAGLSSDDRLSEIYTLRPSQFTVSAKQESTGFDFTYKADPTAFDDDAKIPEAVRNNAESYIKSNTEVTFNTGDKHLPILNFEDSNEIVKTPTIFKFNDNNNNKEFSKNLIFKITGKVRERGYATAQGENITAYPKSDGIIDFGGKTGTNAKSGTFYQGILQTAAPTEIGTIYRNTATVSANGDLTLAKSYKAGSGFRFIKDGSFETDIPYQDGLSFKLYEGVSGYLTVATASDAVNITKAFASGNHKYIINSAGDYELCSSANASDAVQYYLIQDGSSASATKLRKSSSTPEKYSAISGTDYYFVDNKVPKSFEALGFKSIDDYKKVAKTAETSIQENPKTIGSGIVAFIKVNGIWRAVNSNDTITKKYFTTITEDGISKKVYLAGIIKSSAGVFTLTRVDKGAVITLDNSITIGIEYYHNVNTLFTDYCEFTAAAENQVFFVNLSSLDKIINNSAVDGSDFGKIYTPSVAKVNTTYTIKNNYVAYATTETLTELIDGSQNQAYKRNEGKEVTSIGSTSYNFYFIHSGPAYILKGDCNVGTRANNQFVEGYAASYKNYYIFKNGNLSNISEADLSRKTTITYYESDDHHIVGNGVYDDDDDGKKYVMFSDNDWVEGIAINSENTLVNENNVPSPNTTEDVLRFITEVYVNATQSD